MPDADLFEARDRNQDILSRWKIAEPYWRAAEPTSYERSLTIAINLP